MYFTTNYKYLSPLYRLLYLIMYFKVVKIALIHVYNKNSLVSN